MPVNFTPTDQELNLRKALIEACNKIADTDLERLIQTERLGLEVGFLSLAPLFQKTKLLYSTLAASNLDLLSERKLNELMQVAANTQLQLDQFRSFSASGNLTQERSNRIVNFTNQYEDTYAKISPVLGSSIGNAALRESAAAKALSEIQGVKEDVAKEAAQIMASVRETAKQAGIAEHAFLFKNEADNHNRLAIYWLIATGMLATITGIFAWVNYKMAYAALQLAITATPLPQGATAPVGTTSFTIQLALAKLIAFSLLLSAVVWSGRVYRAHRHNYVVNKHRQNALGTFDVFVKAASADDQTKNAVLLQATQCIFSPQSTGYLNAEKELDAASQVVEIVRNIPSSKS
jgi:hypothetical protein